MEYPPCRLWSSALSFRAKRWLWLVGLSWSACLYGCHEPNDTSTVEDDSSPPSDLTATEAEEAAEEPVRISIPMALDEADRWLFAEAVEEGATGGWATGSFDAARNKLEIDTKDLQAFAMDVSRIPIQWERLVILSINGRQSELRKRDYALLHFKLDDYEQWVVVEP